MKQMRAPGGSGDSSAQMRPPCACTMCLATARPSPVPPPPRAWSPRKKRSKTRSRSRWAARLQSPRSSKAVLLIEWRSTRSARQLRLGGARSTAAAICSAVIYKRKVLSKIVLKIIFAYACRKIINKNVRHNALLKAVALTIRVRPPAQILLYALVCRAFFQVIRRHLPAPLKCRHQKRALPIQRSRPP